MQKKLLLALTGLFLFLQTSCNRSEQDEPRTCARNFCQAFFNFNYSDALKYCASGEAGWLKVFISNLLQEDMDSIRHISVTPQFNIEDITYRGDSCALAIIKVHSVYYFDTIGRPGHVVKEGIYNVSMIREKGKWRIRTGDLRQNGK